MLTGTYLVYPWYRAVPPRGADLHPYPKALLLSNPATANLHSIGMEWKEHIAFLAPIAFTVVVYVLCRYGRHMPRHPQIRRLLLAFSATAVLCDRGGGRRGSLPEQGRTR